MHKKFKKNNFKDIGDLKKSTELDDLCSDLPSCFKKYLEYCQQLDFDEDPDYRYMKSIFRNGFAELRIRPKFEWVK